MKIILCAILLTIMYITPVFAIRMTTNVTQLPQKTQKKIAKREKKKRVKEQLKTININQLNSIPQLRNAIKQILDYLDIQYQQ